MLVTACDRTPAILECDEIDNAIDACKVRPHFAEHTQSCDSAIGVDVESQVRPNQFGIDFDIMMGVPLQGSFCKQLGPAIFRHVGFARAGVDRRLWRVVAGEMARIDVKS